jgi:hypothetical protein
MLLAGPVIDTRIRCLTALGLALGRALCDACARAARPSGMA